MRILALEPYYGGSHRAFLDGWARRSRHHWTILGLPAHSWKWRMRHAPLTLARRAAEQHHAGERWDAVFCTDMLDLAQWRGLVPSPLRDLPAVAYFHENQLTYPDPNSGERDLHFGFSNLITALAAEQVWFNSAYHRDEFLAAAEALLQRMRDYQHLDEIHRLRERAEVRYPCIDRLPPRPDERQPGPLRIVWAHRWEQDKNPETLFEAIDRLRQRKVDFRLSVLGEQFGDAPGCFERARRELDDCIDHWGYAPSRREYVQELIRGDVFVSTANQEFFGLSTLEAAAAGCYPLLPKRLAYPEIFGDVAPDHVHFYDGSAEQLADRLARLAEECDKGDYWDGETCRCIRAAWRYVWDGQVDVMDEALQKADSK